jgi:hypothetical protein
MIVDFLRQHNISKSLPRPRDRFKVYGIYVDCATQQDLELAKEVVMASEEVLNIVQGCGVNVFFVIAPELNY